MSDHRTGFFLAALMLVFAVPFGLCGQAQAQSHVYWYLAHSGILVAEYAGTVLELQRELNQLGFDAGPIDGVMGARTRTAIQGYQRDHDLLVDGHPTSSLLSHVRATAQTGGLARNEP